jgi:hypothetical protein
MPVDPTTLPACSPMCNGAHCLPSAEVPASVQGELAACSGGFCVPDQDIMAGTLLKPPSCTSLSNAPGVCLSVCIPQVAMYVSLLPQGSCPRRAADDIRQGLLASRAYHRRLRPI